MSSKIESKDFMEAYFVLCFVGVIIFYSLFEFIVTVFAFLFVLFVLYMICSFAWSLITPNKPTGLNK